MKNKLEKKTKQKKGWIKDLTEYEKSIFVNMLNEAAMKKRRWVTKKERLEVTNRFREVVNALREANGIKDNKDNVVSEQKIVSEVNVSDVIKVKKERKPRVRI